MEKYNSRFLSAQADAFTPQDRPGQAGVNAEEKAGLLRTE
jgi:hypothetical protein